MVKEGPNLFSSDHSLSLKRRNFYSTSVTLASEDLMSEEGKKPLIDFEDEDDDSILEDDEDDLSCSSTQKLYTYYSFPIEEPTSVRFKGKNQIFVNSVKTLKDLLKRGEGSCVNNVSFKVLDTRKMPHGIEYDIQSSKNKDKGVSVLKVYGPNQKKGCTVMICKSREYEIKFVSILANDIVKYLLDNFEKTDGWKNVLEFSSSKKPACQVCKKLFCNEKNLKVHMKKYHTSSVDIKCGVCDINFENETGLQEHNKSKHTQQKADVAVLEVQGEEDLKMEVDTNDTNPNSEDEKISVQVLEEKIKTLKKEHENIVNNLTNKLEEKEAQYKTNITRLEKEDLRKRNEIKMLKEENTKILEKLGQLQWNTDKRDAEIKAKEKMEKIKENTKLFNDLIKKQTNEENNMDMEVCDGGYTNKTQQNEGKEFKRTTTQEVPEIARRIEACEKRIIKCPQCDFVTPSEIFFNEHMTNVHTGPNCPFCFLPFNTYTELRKHCTDKHDELKKENMKSDQETSKNKNMNNWRSKKPCRFFRNGEGVCSPRNGRECEFDHDIIPFSDRQECYNKHLCHYKPYCIYYHPEGQNVENWQKNKKKVSKVCYYVQQGLVCMRSECNFYHPTTSNYQGFQWELLKKPPIITNPIKKMRVPVIVKNKNQVNRLSQSLKGLELD